MRLSILSAVTAFVLVFAAAAQASTSPSYTLTVQTGASSYFGNQIVSISGKVSPAPGPDTAVFVTVSNPSGKVVYLNQDSVNGTTGVFSDSFTAGTSSSWLDGTYTVNATWGAYGSTIHAVTTFTWSSSQSTTTSTTAQVPEFIPVLLPLVLLASLMFVAFARRLRRP